MELLGTNTVGPLDYEAREMLKEYNKQGLNARQAIAQARNGRSTNVMPYMPNKVVGRDTAERNVFSDGGLDSP